MVTQKLTLNIDKTLYIMFGNKAKNIQLNMKINNTHIARQEEGNISDIHHDSKLNVTRIPSTYVKKFTKQWAFFSRIFYLPSTTYTLSL